MALLSHGAFVPTTYGAREVPMEIGSLLRFGWVHHDETGKIPQRGASYSARAARQAPSVERKWWIFVDQEQQIRLDAQHPAHDSKRKRVERRRITSREENRKPCDDRAQHPCEDEKEQHDQMRHGEDETHRDGRAVTDRRFGDCDCRRIWRVAERRIWVDKQR